MPARRGRNVRRVSGGKMAVQRRGAAAVGVTSAPQFRVNLEQRKPTIIVTDTRGRTRVLGQKPRAMTRRKAQKANAVARERRKRKLVNAMKRGARSPGRYAEEGYTERGSDGKLRLTEKGKLWAAGARETLRRRAATNAIEKLKAAGYVREKTGGYVREGLAGIGLVRERTSEYVREGLAEIGPDGKLILTEKGKEVLRMRKGK